jgi:hypothetical protein
MEMEPVGEEFPAVGSHNYLPFSGCLPKSCDIQDCAQKYTNYVWYN